jgi:UDP-perosamine 4-acetyltransferase
VILGAGKGAEVILDILFWNMGVRVIQIRDDNVFGTQLCGIDVVRGCKVPDLRKDVKLIVSITSNMKYRRELFEYYKDRGYSFMNVIHGCALVSDSSVWGEGNVVCAGARVGIQSKIGDNNMISSHCDIEHHNEVGSHNLFGPGVKTSGSVKIGDSNVFGVNAGLTPGVKVASYCSVAGGLCLWHDLRGNEHLKWNSSSVKKTIYHSKTL